METRINQSILVTGGLGYIGSHTVVRLLEHDYNVIVLDNLSNSDVGMQERIARITGKPLQFVVGDIRDRTLLAALLKDYAINSVFILPD